MSCTGKQLDGTTPGSQQDGTHLVDFRLSLLIARVQPGGAISYIISVWFTHEITISWHALACIYKIVKFNLHISQ